MLATFKILSALLLVEGGMRKEWALRSLTTPGRAGGYCRGSFLYGASLPSFPAVPHLCSTSERPCLPEGCSQELGHWQPPSCRNCQGVPQEWLTGTHLHRPKNLPEVPASKYSTAFPESHPEDTACNTGAFWVNIHAYSWWTVWRKVSTHSQGISTLISIQMKI